MIGFLIVLKPWYKEWMIDKKTSYLSTSLCCHFASHQGQELMMILECNIKITLKHGRNFMCTNWIRWNYKNTFNQVKLQGLVNYDGCIVQDSSLTISARAWTEQILEEGLKYDRVTSQYVVRKWERSRVKYCYSVHDWKSAAQIPMWKSRRAAYRPLI